MDFCILPGLGRTAKATVVKRRRLVSPFTVERVEASVRVKFPGRFVEFRRPPPHPLQRFYFFVTTKGVGFRKISASTTNLRFA